MFIPLQTPRDRFLLKEQIKIDEEFLSERLHSFNWQHSVAKECATKFFPMIPTVRNKMDKYIINITTENPFVNQILLVAETQDIVPVPYGRFVAYNHEEKRATIELVIMKGWFETDNNKIKSLTSVIGHELSHVGSILNKYDGDITAYVPHEQYENLILAMKATSNYSNYLEKDIYEYCYSMYCTSNVEITAFISQTEFDLRKIAGKDFLTMNEIKKYLPLTNSYQAFTLAKNVAIKMLSRTKYDKEWFCEQLSKYGINVKNIDKQMKYLEYRADEGIEKCASNAMNTLEEK